jgi:hypothetical protein
METVTVEVTDRSRNARQVVGRGLEGMMRMGTYVREVEDVSGNLVDVHYLCSEACWRDSFAQDRLGPASWTGAGRLTEGGARACAESEIGAEREVCCAECGVVMASPEGNAPAVVNLVSRPPIEELARRRGFDGFMVPAPVAPVWDQGRESGGRRGSTGSR